MTTSASSSGAIVLMPTTPHLVWSATTARRRPDAASARLVSASSRLGLVKPVRSSMPCTPRKTMSRFSERRAATATGPTSASDGVRTPPVSTTVCSARGLLVEDRGDLHAVRHDGDAGHVEQPVRQRPGRGAGREPDGEPGLHQRVAAARDRVLLVALAHGLRLEARLVGAGAARDGGAAVDLVDQALAGQLVEVTAHRHVRDVELAGQVADPHRAPLPDAVGDVGLSFPREHPRSRPSRRGGSSQQKRTVHLWESVGFTRLGR